MNAKIPGWRASLLAAVALLAGCAADAGVSSSDLRFGERRECAGAFTPHSDVCWDPTEPTPVGQIMTDSLTAQEIDGEVSGADRCAQGIMGVPGTEGRLKISFMTQPLRGTYGPRNCGAVWIEDSFKMFVRTTEVWAEERFTSIVFWYGRACKEGDPTLTDAISSATLANHQLHESTWDTRDFRGNVVPDGEYTLWMQVTENEVFPEGPFMRIPFTKGPTGWTAEPPAEMGFAEIKLEYTPGVPASAATAP